MDSRIKILTRILKIELLDECHLDFTQDDLEWIGEQIEFILQQKFTVKVNLITCEIQK